MGDRRLTLRVPREVGPRRGDYCGNRCGPLEPERLLNERLLDDALAESRTSNPCLVGPRETSLRCLFRTAAGNDIRNRRGRLADLPRGQPS